MTYRDDHEAALLRIDALEAELAAARSPAVPPEPIRPHVVTPTDRAVGRAIGSVLLYLVCVVLAALGVSL